MNCGFILDINLSENTNDYIFDLSYDIESEFIRNLLQEKRAKLILVIQSKDNKFFEVEKNKNSIKISKSRMSLSKKTLIQLLIQSKGEITFENNCDLSSFYEEFKGDIIVPKNSILGFSNNVVFDGSNEKPLDLFEKKIDPNLKSDVKIELGNETIIINYKKENLQFNDFASSSILNSPYIYMGLQKALYRFIVLHGGEDEIVFLDEVGDQLEGIDSKLYNLMKMKMIDKLNVDNIDEVIYSISDRILEKYTAAVRRLNTNGN
jgi:hypothetical protein